MLTRSSESILNPMRYTGSFLYQFVIIIYLQVPHYKTVKKIQVVPTTLYKTQYKRLIETRLVPHYSTYTESKYKQTFHTETKLLNKYHTQYSTIYKTKTVVKHQYHTKTIVVKTTKTKYQPQYHTKTVHEPEYKTKTVYKTRVAYKTKIVEKPSYHNQHNGYHH